MDADSAGLDARLAFIRELDRLKRVLRQTRLIDGSRHENTAEHSWHLATMALVLREHAPDGTDVTRAIEMLLVHDVVEIDAGDTFAFDTSGNGDKADRERQAADRLFGMLPAEQGRALRGRWEEFERDETPTARFANALDRLQPLLLNDAAGDGGSWRRHGVTREAVLRRMRPIETGLPSAWAMVLATIDAATRDGHLKDPPSF
jgi:putative hydrolases of HD superfamily